MAEAYFERHSGQIGKPCLLGLTFSRLQYYLGNRAEFTHVAAVNKRLVFASG